MESSPLTSAEGSPQHVQDAETVVFRGCRSGLGIKIIGGINEEEDDGKDHGVFVKRIIAGGRAAEKGSLKEGDQLLSVNGKSLTGVSNQQAVEYLRSASATNLVTLAILRSSVVNERYNALLDSKLAEMSGGSPLTSDHDNSSSENVSTGSTTPRNEGTTTDGSSPRPSSPHEIILSKSAGLGIAIAGGTNRRGEGRITITDMIPGGDCHKDSRLSQGDILLSINGESLQGVNHEMAKNILTRISLNRDIKTVVLRYIPSGRGARKTPVDESTGSYGYPTGTSHSSSAGTVNTPPSTGKRELPNPPRNSQRASDVKSGNNTTGDGNSIYDHSRHAGQSPDYPGINRASTLPPPPPPPVISQTMNNNIGTRTLPLPGSRGGRLDNNRVEASNRSPGDGGSLLNGRAGPVKQPLPGRVSPQVQTQMLPASVLGQQNPVSSLPPHMQRLAFPEPALHSTPQNASGGTQGYLPPPQSFLSPVFSEHHHHHPERPPEFDPHSSLSSFSAAHSPQPRRLSIDPSLKLKVEKLQVALEYLGLQLNDEQKQHLRNHLNVDSDGMVQYGEFVAVAKQLFKMTLNETNLGSLSMKSHDAVDFATSPTINQQMPYMSGVVTIPVAELESLKRERDNAVLDARKCRSILQERERSFNRAEEELLRVRKDAQGAIHESRALKSRVHLAEAAQKEARNMEMDYEEVMRLLEGEVADLREQLKERPLPKKEPTESIEDLRKRLAVLGGELRKSDTSKKTFEVATERLLQFAEFIHDYAVDGLHGYHQGAKGETARRGQNGVYYPPSYLARHRKKGQVDLSAEAKDVVKAVKALIEVEPLPYGWEETYTKDGSRFFTNHVTQTTTWVHPVSNINHSSAIGMTLQDLPETVT
ncbi:syntaxin-binding protein 4-like isoform X2 [Apostichopus japonicus]|uniref:syntaxin-binding protein 4-like isoform X2 n=1 Tax=Stichopus japonicus TaxID=307972 RepID=UPI003AB1A97B